MSSILISEWEISVVFINHHMIILDLKIVTYVSLTQTTTSTTKATTTTQQEQQHTMQIIQSKTVNKTKADFDYFTCTCTDLEL